MHSFAAGIERVQSVTGAASSLHDAQEMVRSAEGEVQDPVVNRALEGARTQVTAGESMLQ
jgi:hypothetical protein